MDDLSINSYNTYAFKDTELNALYYNGFLADIKLLAMNIFKWKGLPETIEPHFIEELLFERGYCGFMYDKKLGNIVLSCAPWTINDVNFKPTNAVLVGMGYTANRLVYYNENSGKTIVTQNNNIYNKDTACVIIKNNDLYISTFKIIAPYLDLYFKSKRKLGVMVDQLSLQNILVGDVEDRNNFNTLINKVKNNTAFNFLDVKKMKVRPEVLNLPIDYKGQELETLSKTLYGECLGKLGINILDFEKRAQMSEDEISQNDTQIDTRLGLMLKVREEACERINALFGLNVSVEINEEAVKINDNSMNSDFGTSTTNFNRNYQGRTGEEKDHGNI